LRGWCSRTPWRAFKPTLTAAEAIKANPQKSDRAIAVDLGINQSTVSRARSRDADASPLRVGRDGKQYLVKQRITDDPDIDPELANEAAATGRRRDSAGRGCY